MPREWPQLAHWLFPADDSRSRRLNAYLGGVSALGVVVFFFVEIGENDLVEGVLSQI